MLVVPKPPSPKSTGYGVMLGEPEVQKGLLVIDVEEAAAQLEKGKALEDCPGVVSMSNMAFNTYITKPNTEEELGVMEKRFVSTEEEASLLLDCIQKILDHFKVVSVKDLWENNGIYVGWLILRGEAVHTQRELWRYSALIGD